MIYIYIYMNIILHLSYHNIDSKRSPKMEGCRHVPTILLESGTLCSSQRTMASLSICPSESQWIAGAIVLASHLMGSTDFYRRHSGAFASANRGAEYKPTLQGGKAGLSWQVLHHPMQCLLDPLGLRILQGLLPHADRNDRVAIFEWMHTHENSERERESESDTHHTWIWRMHSVLNFAALRNPWSILFPQARLDTFRTKLPWSASMAFWLLAIMAWCFFRGHSKHPDGLITEPQKTILQKHDGTTTPCCFYVEEQW